MSFDPVAPWYQMLERIAFGEDLQRCRVACLGEIAAPHRALIVGEGNGRFLCALLRLHPGIEVACLDESCRMLQLARERMERELPARAGRVRFFHQEYPFFRLTARIPASELIDPTPFLQGEGFALARQHLFRKGMLKSERWSRNP